MRGASIVKRASAVGRTPLRVVTPVVRPLSSSAGEPKHPYVNEEDMKFLLNTVGGLDELLEDEYFSAHTKDGIFEFLDIAAKLSENYFGPHNRAGDLDEPRLEADGSVTVVPEVKDAIEALYESGIPRATFPEDVGGFQIPTVAQTAMIAPITASNPGTAVIPFLTIAASGLLHAYGSEEQKAKYLGPMLDGRFAGTMNLSETHAGSSLGDIRTKAVSTGQEDGAYSIKGSKMWISGGEQSITENIVHFVLARTEGAPAGVKGISLFLVPKFRVNDNGSLGEHNDVVCTGLNHKMGYRGGPNAVLNYGENDSCLGYLVGEENKGLACMFHMMNEARIGVGLNATCLGYAGYAASSDYAASRTQGRPLANRDPESPQIPIIEHSDVRRMLLQQKSYVEGAMALCMYASYLVDKTTTAARNGEPLSKYNAILDTITPIVKAWPSEWCLEANKWAIQILGGYGYTRDFPVEQTYRDNRLNMIHEGTNGIQSIDLLGRKVVINKSAGLKALGAELGATIFEAQTLLPSLDEDDAKLVGECAETMERAAHSIIETTTTLLRAGATNPDLMLANSHEYLNMTGTAVIGWMWLKQINALVQSKDDYSSAFVEGKRYAALYFMRHEMSKIQRQADLLQSLDDTVLVCPPRVL